MKISFEREVILIKFSFRNEATGERGGADNREHFRVISHLKYESMTISHLHLISLKRSPFCRHSSFNSKALHIVHLFHSMSTNCK